MIKYRAVEKASAWIKERAGSTKKKQKRGSAGPRFQKNDVD